MEGRLRAHLQYILAYVGIWPREELPAISGRIHAAEALEREWTGGCGIKFRVRFVLFAKSSQSEKLLQPVRKIRLREMLTYLSGRFRCYSPDPGSVVRSLHSQWDPFIRELYDRLLPPSGAPPVSIEQTLDWVLGRIPPEAATGNR